MQKRKIFTVLTVVLLMLSVSAQVFAQPGSPDRDGDGVPDADDDCVSEPGPRSNNGCPVPPTPIPNDDIPDDTDGDGTADPLDACPNEPGDGANSGCPEGVDPTNPTTGENADSPPAQLGVAPPSEDCIVSPAGAYSVNIRVAPSPTSDAIGVLEMNEWAIVYAISYEGSDPMESQHQFGGAIKPLGIQPPIADPDGTEPVDPDSESLWLLIETEDGLIGWVAELVIRYAGNCSGFDLPEPDPAISEVFFLPNDGGGVEFPSTNAFLTFPTTPPGPDPVPGLIFDVRLPDEDNGESLEFAPECMLVELGGGASILECADGSTPMFTYCVVEQGAEAGMFVENCYEVEVPDGCTVETAEAGVWKIVCPEEGTVNIGLVGGEQLLFAQNEPGVGILVGLLLPAVQKVRE